MLWLTRVLARAGLAPTPDKVVRMPVARRAAMRPPPWMTFPSPVGARIRYESFAGRGGSLPLKLFIPPLPDSTRAPVLFLHGGGWICGGVDSLDYFCANLCLSTRVPVVAVGYRLAPEHPFPAALMDGEDALAWLAANAARLGAGSGGVAVAGDSAGGNLAAALCLQVREAGGPRIVHQALIYPSLDGTLQSPSLAIRGTGLARGDIASMIEAYRGHAPASDPLVSPLLATDLSRLPPALIATADRDVLRDDGARYAERLREAGVVVRHENYPAMPHGFLSMPKLCAGAPAALVAIVTEMGAHLDLGTAA